MAVSVTKYSGSFIAVVIILINHSDVINSLSVVAGFPLRDRLLEFVQFRTEEYDNSCLNPVTVFGYRINFDDLYSLELNVLTEL